MAIPFNSGTKYQNDLVEMNITIHCKNDKVEKVQLFMVSCILVVELTLLWLKITCS
nr:ORF7 [Bracoviriform inaniti]